MSLNISFLNTSFLKLLYWYRMNKIFISGFDIFPLVYFSFSIICKISFVSCVVFLTFWSTSYQFGTTLHKRSKNAIPSSWWMIKACMSTVYSLTGFRITMFQIYPSFYKKIFFFLFNCLIYFSFKMLKFIKNSLKMESLLLLYIHWSKQLRESICFSVFFFCA